MESESFNAGGCREQLIAAIGALYDELRVVLKDIAAQPRVPHSFIESAAVRRVLSEDLLIRDIRYDDDADR
jgi:hypothetical protein